MEYRRLGNSDLLVSRISLGTWKLGGGSEWGTEGTAIDKSHFLEECINQGINLIDTAPCYGLGKSEQLIGQALKKDRERVILSTKCGLWWKYPTGEFFYEQDGIKVYKSLSCSTLLQEIDMSLQRLGTDYIDIYHLHWPDINTPIEVTIKCIETIKKTGKIKYLAVTNFSLDAIEIIRKYIPIVDIQLKYSALDKNKAMKYFQYAKKNNIGIVIHSVLENGLLSDDYLKQNFFPCLVQKRNMWLNRKYKSSVNILLYKLNELAKSLDVTISQLLISWYCYMKEVDSIIVGMSTSEHLNQCINASQLIVSAKISGGGSYVGSSSLLPNQKVPQLHTAAEAP